MGDRSFATVLPARRWLLRCVLAAVILGFAIAGVVAGLSYERIRLAPGTVEEPKNGSTVVSAQGFEFAGAASGKKPARLARFGPNATLEWETLGSPTGAWFYDVDPLPSGNLLVSSPLNGDTRVFAYDAATGEQVWREQLDAHDTHDVDLVNDDQLLVADMRRWNATADRSDDRLFLYDRTNDTVVWEWYFRTHYDNDTEGGFNKDWTHVNDVEKVGNGQFLASPRNFDQVILVNRSTSAIEWRVGADDRHSTLNEQHNADYLTGPAGRPTVLVADSEKDRVVEFAREPNGSWTAVWSVTGFNWPRDADRLPNGNTLVVDSLHHRVVEVTPAGEVVWEVYVPWAPYDAERVRHGDESAGPTMRAVGASGATVVHGGAGMGPAGSRTPADVLARIGEGTPLHDQFLWLARGYAHVVPWLRPVWLAPWAFAYLVAGVLLGVAWGIGEAAYSSRVRRQVGRVRSVPDGVRTLPDRVRGLVDRVRARGRPDPGDGEDGDEGG